LFTLFVVCFIFVFCFSFLITVTGGWALKTVVYFSSDGKSQYYVSLEHVTVRTL